MRNLIRNLKFILLIICLLQTRTIAGPLAYAACLANCMGWTLPAVAVAPPSAVGASVICAAICAPVLVAPTP
jgi:hypothetical protein